MQIGFNPMKFLLALVFTAFLMSPAAAQGLPPGGISGSTAEASPANLALTWQQAFVVVPGSPVWKGRLPDMPALDGKRPVALFMHGSSGLADFTEEFQTWLASIGIASIAPNSFAIADRLKYASPVPVALYERIHALRSAELANAIAQARSLPWVDADKIIVIGSSEGSVPVARLGAAPGVAARVILSWSCEASYFVDGPRTATPKDAAVLTVIASRDPFFSPLNPWNAGHATTGSCASAFRYHTQAMNVVIATEQHTIMNLPATREIIAPFLRRTVQIP